MGPRGARPGADSLAEDDAVLQAQLEAGADAHAGHLLDPAAQVLLGLRVVLGRDLEHRASVSSPSPSLTPARLPVSVGTTAGHAVTRSHRAHSPTQRTPGASGRINLPWVSGEMGQHGEKLGLKRGKHGPTPRRPARDTQGETEQRFSEQSWSPCGDSEGAMCPRPSLAETLPVPGQQSRGLLWAPGRWTEFPPSAGLGAGGAHAGVSEP